jgi:hypothetical protein
MGRRQHRRRADQDAGAGGLVEVEKADHGPWRLGRVDGDTVVLAEEGALEGGGERVRLRDGKRRGRVFAIGCGIGADPDVVLPFLRGLEGQRRVEARVVVVAMPFAVGRVDQQDGVVARLHVERQRRAVGREEDPEIRGIGEVSGAADASGLVGVFAPDIAARQQADPVGVGQEARLD